MPNSDPSPETRFQKGRAKTGGRQKGTPNKPKSIKIAMRQFTDENGGELLDWARGVFATPDLVEVGDKVINILPAKVALFRYALEYGIGTPPKAAPDGPKNQLQIVVKYPLGVDPVEMREPEEALNDAREVQALARPGKPTAAILKAARAVPEVIADPIDPSLELEPVTDSDFPNDPSLDVHSEDLTR